MNIDVGSKRLCHLLKLLIFNVICTVQMLRLCIYRSNVRYNNSVGLSLYFFGRCVIMVIAYILKLYSADGASAFQTSYFSSVCQYSSTA